MNTTIKKITLLIIQFDADIKANKFKGIMKFINDFEPLYKSLLVNNNASEFKKEVKEIFEYLFSDEKIFDYAFGKLKDKYGSITITSELAPLFKKIYEIKSKHTPFDWAVAERFRPDPLKEFVSKYQNILINYKSGPVVEITLRNVCKGPKEYESIKSWFIENKFCDPVTFNWLDNKKGCKSILANYLTDLKAKRYTDYLNQKQIIAMAKNSFNLDIGIDTIKRLKGNPVTKSLPEIPYFKN